jgi:hypothetical protein
MVGVEFRIRGTPGFLVYTNRSGKDFAAER